MNSGSRVYPASCSDPSEIVGHCDGCELFHILKTVDIAMYIDGASSGNGKPDAEAGVGVYWTCDDDANVSKPLPGLPQTSQRAEINAAIEAMRQARQLERMGVFGAYDGLVLITDSAYLVNAMAELIYRWNKNGWKNASGNQVGNMDDFKKLEQHILFFEKRDISVRFWKVDRKYNEEADRLAKDAIKSSSGR